MWRSTRKGNRSRWKTQVLIDGACPYCRALGRGLKALDWGGRLWVRPLQEAEGLDQKALLEELFVLEAGRAHRGYGALLHLSRRLPPLWPLYPLLLLGGLLGVGPRAYRALARRRPRA